eukprot:3823311-Amphidinium_carterae.1
MSLSGRNKARRRQRKLIPAKECFRAGEGFWCNGTVLPHVLEGFRKHRIQSPSKFLKSDALNDMQRKR